jgi:pimeloyl-ACP methyl ester carboxylesterase
MTEITHRFITTNGLRMHIAEAGTGPLVVLCHGFPELWYSWRNQLTALAEAGFHVVAPDMRGYGETDAPHDIDQYTLLHLVGDMVGLLNALGAPRAAIAGHDWGAPVAWHAALLRPDRFHAVIGLSVPFRPPPPVRPTSLMRQTETAMFYQLYFQQPGVAEADLEQDVRFYIRGVLFSNSGDGSRSPADPAKRDSVGMVPRTGGLLARMATHMTQPTVLPAWLSEADVDVYATAFQRTGFRGGLNWYRNIDRNWELLGAFAGRRIEVPALFIAGERDLVGAFPGGADAVATLSERVPALRRVVALPGCGHWTQQERPAEVNEAMIAFLHAELPR